MSEIGLVSCTKSKRGETAKPADLYMESAFFRKARKYVVANHDDWYILSARHHLLDPDGLAIEPYDETLSGASVDTKRKWSYDELLPLLEDTPVQFETPTDGLKYGETLAWYNERI